MRRTLLLVGFALLFPLPALALGDGVAVITSTDASDIQTGTEIRRDLVGECIVKLPTEAQLVPVSSSVDEYFHKIDGTERNDYMPVWTSTVQIGWQVRQRFLYVVTTKGVGQTAAPQFREVTGLVHRSAEVRSEPSESTHFAMNSKRVRFFTTAADAEASVKKRAAAKLRELQSNLCSAESN